MPELVAERSSLVRMSSAHIANAGENTEGGAVAYPPSYVIVLMMHGMRLRARDCHSVLVTERRVSQRVPVTMRRTSQRVPVTMRRIP